MTTDQLHSEAQNLDSMRESALYVDYSEVYVQDIPRHDKFYKTTEGFTGEAWRVGCKVDGVPYVFLTAFGRKRDAEAAKAALERDGLVDAVSIRAAGRERLERIMAEAMQW